MRVLGVDFGERRVGVSVSDPSGLIAQSWGIITRTSHRQVAERLAELVQELEAARIVVGLPFSSAGEEGFQARRVRRFVEVLESTVQVPVELWDETLTSVEADRLLAGRPERKRRRHRDDVAAAVLLQSYLDAHRPCQPEPQSERG